jgi:HEAT repeat protein
LLPALAAGAVVAVGVAVIVLVAVKSRNPLEPPPAIELVQEPAPQAPKSQSVGPGAREAASPEREIAPAPPQPKAPPPDPAPGIPRPPTSALGTQLALELPRYDEILAVKPTDARFAEFTFENKLEGLRTHGLDVVITFDSSSRMGPELDEVKRKIRRISNALKIMVPGVRVGICTYRDFGDDYVVKGLALTDNPRTVDDYLQPVAAAGGGAEAHAVHEGLLWSIQKNHFRTDARKVILLFGDTRPYPQHLRVCTSLADQFRRQQHGIVSTVTCRRLGAGADAVEPSKLPEFAEIARAGGGESFVLADQKGLMQQLLVMVFGNEHRDRVLEVYRLLEEAEPKGALLDGRSIREETIPEIARRLKDADPGARSAARLILVALGRQAVPHLIPLLKEPKARTEVAGILGAIGKPAEAAVPVLLETLKAAGNADRDYQQAGTLALARLGRRDLGPLLKAARSADEPESAHALQALALMGPDAGDAAPVFVEALKARGQERRLLAVNGLAKVDPRGKLLRRHVAACLPVLVDALGHDDRAVRSWAIGAVEKLGPDAGSAAAQPLLRLLREERDADLRAQAALALGRVGLKDEEAIPTLVDVQTDSDARVRHAAARGLVFLGPAALRHPDLQLRQRVLAIIKSLAAEDNVGKDVGSIAADMLRVMRNGDEAVRDSVQELLGQMDPELAPALPMYRQALTRRPSAPTDPPSIHPRNLPFASSEELVRALPGVEGERRRGLLEELRRRRGPTVLGVLMVATLQGTEEDQDLARKLVSDYLVNKPAPDSAGRAAGKLQRARELARIGKGEAARERYREIIEEYPGTPAAEEARGLLRK